MRHCTVNASRPLRVCARKWCVCVCVFWKFFASVPYMGRVNLIRSWKKKLLGSRSRAYTQKHRCRQMYTHSHTQSTYEWAAPNMTRTREKTVNWKVTGNYHRTPKQTEGEYQQQQQHQPSLIPSQCDLMPVILFSNDLSFDEHDQWCIFFACVLHNCVADLKVENDGRRQLC